MPDLATIPYEVFSHPVLPCIVMKWKGYPSSDAFREGTEKMLELLKQQNFNKVIADVKELKLITSDDQEWVLHTFLPKALKEGFRVMAFINSDDYYARNVIENMAYKINLENMDFGFFDTYEAAEKWIQDTEYHQPGFEIAFNSEIPCVELKWHGSIGGKEFKIGLEAMVALIAEKKCSNAVINLEMVPYSVDLETHKWIKENFLPEAISRGFKKAAFINPGIYNSLSIYTIASGFPSDSLQVEIFEDLESAKKWLLNKVNVE
ncbi:MAG TPA: hypothetical protein VD908_07875 [Cytophagales bacterium]|nr:hypothetical protein [Cytophagales bacterium]